MLRRVAGTACRQRVAWTAAAAGGRCRTALGPAGPAGRRWLATAHADPFTVLGVSRGASQDEIKKAYRKLVKKHHPDTGGDAKKFAEVQGAYEALTGNGGGGSTGAGGHQGFGQGFPGGGFPGGGFPGGGFPGGGFPGGGFPGGQQGFAGFEEMFRHAARQTPGNTSGRQHVEMNQGPDGRLRVKIITITDDGKRHVQEFEAQVPPGFESQFGRGFDPFRRPSAFHGGNGNGRGGGGSHMRMSKEEREEMERAAREMRAEMQRMASQMARNMLAEAARRVADAVYQGAADRARSAIHGVASTISDGLRDLMGQGRGRRGERGRRGGRK